MLLLSAISHFILGLGASSIVSNTKDEIQIQAGSGNRNSWDKQLTEKQIRQWRVSTMVDGSAW